MENRLAVTPQIIDPAKLAPTAAPAVASSLAPEPLDQAKQLAPKAEASSGAENVASKVVTPGPLESQIASGQINGADLRLVIEEDKGSYVYKTINRITGETLSQYPRADVIRMRDAADYTAGKIVNAKA